MYIAQHKYLLKVWTFFLIGFHSQWTKQPLTGMELQNKDEDKEENHISKANQEEPKDNSYLRGPSIKSVLSNKTNKPPPTPLLKQ